MGITFSWALDRNYETDEYIYPPDARGFWHFFLHANEEPWFQVLTGKSPPDHYGKNLTGIWTPQVPTEPGDLEWTIGWLWADVHYECYPGEPPNPYYFGLEEWCSGNQSVYTMEIWFFHPRFNHDIHEKFYLYAPAFTHFKWRGVSEPGEIPSWEPRIWWFPWFLPLDLIRDNAYPDIYHWQNECTSFYGTNFLIGIHIEPPRFGIIPILEMMKGAKICPL
jgi:hypothetical protein